MFRTFPLMAIPVALYNLIVFGGMLGNAKAFDILSKSFTIPMRSDEWVVQAGDFVLLVAIAMLFIEVIKSSGTSRKEMINNALSMIVFVVALVEFVLLGGFATSNFFFIMVMCLFDSVAGPTITAVAAKRDLGIGQSLVDGA